MHKRGRRPANRVKYELPAQIVVTDGEMKVLLVLTIMLLAAASAYAYGRSDMAFGLSTVMEHTAGVVISDRMAMVLSGGLLLAVAGAVRRLPL